MQRRAGVAAFAGYVFLLIGWLAATPPFNAPDEVSHFIRAYGLGQGNVVGEAPDYVAPPADVRADPVALARYRWAYETTTFVQVPPALDPFGRDCARDPTVGAVCVDEVEGPGIVGALPTNTGTTTPVAIGVAALLMRAGGDPGAAVAFARVGQLATTVFALGIVLLGLRSAGRPALAGLALAATPMVLYVGVVLNPSGPEVWATLACMVASWRMLAPDRVGRTWVWIAAASAALLTLTRQPGLVWAIIAVASAVGLRSGEGVWPLLRGRWRALAVWLGGWLLGVAVATAWNTVVAVETPLALEPLDGALVQVWDDLPNLLRHVVGEFNLFEVALPSAVYRTWLVLVLGVVVVAIWQAPRRWWVPLVPVAGTVAFTLAFWLLSYRFTGFGLQGRHMLPAFVLIPLVACLALREPVGPLGRRMTAGLVSLVAVLQVVAWGATARRFAVGVEGALAFWQAPVWDPVGGWLPWMAVVVVGAGLLAFGAWLPYPGSGSPGRGDPLRRRRATGQRPAGPWARESSTR